MPTCNVLNLRLLDAQILIRLMAFVNFKKISAMREQFFLFRLFEIAAMWHAAVRNHTEREQKRGASCSFLPICVHFSKTFDSLREAPASKFRRK